MIGLGNYVVTPQVAGYGDEYSGLKALLLLGLGVGTLMFFGVIKTPRLPRFSPFRAARMEHYRRARAKGFRRAGALGYAAAKMGD